MRSISSSTHQRVFDRSFKDGGICLVEDKPLLLQYFYRRTVLPKTLFGKAASVHPVNLFSLFHSLSPCLSKTTLYISDAPYSDLFLLLFSPLTVTRSPSLRVFHSEDYNPVSLIESFCYMYHAPLPYTCRHFTSLAMPFSSSRT